MAKYRVIYAEYDNPEAIMEVNVDIPQSTDGKELARAARAGHSELAARGVVTPQVLVSVEAVES